MKSVSFILLIFLGLAAVAVTQQLNSDEDVSAPVDSFKRPVDSFKRPVASFKRPTYGPNNDNLSTEPLTFPTDSLNAPQSTAGVRANAGGSGESSGSERDPRESESALDSSIARNVRYTTSGGYGGSSGGTGFGYSSGGSNFGWTGTNPGYSSGGIVCTVCSNYDVANAQRCCGFGYRQCCNVGVTGYNYNQPIGGAGFNYISPTTYNSGSGYEKPGNCRNTYGSSFGSYNSGRRGLSLVNQNSGYYYTRRSDDDDDVDYVENGRVVKRDAPLAYGPPYNTGTGGYNSGGYNSGGSGYYSGGGYSSTSSGGYPSSWGGGHHGGNGLPPSNSGYCRTDYDCPGIQKCCGRYCSNPIANVG